MEYFWTCFLHDRKNKQTHNYRNNPKIRNYSIKLKLNLQVVKNCARTSLQTTLLLPLVETKFDLHENSNQYWKKLWSVTEGLQICQIELLPRGRSLWALAASSGHPESPSPEPSCCACAARTQKTADIRNVLRCLSCQSNHVSLKPREAGWVIFAQRNMFNLIQTSQFQSSVGFIYSCFNSKQNY